MQEEFELDLIGALEGTDKASSIRWTYLQQYPRLLAKFRREKFNLLEIGVLGGGSLRMWSSYFPSATIVGIDIFPGCARYANPPRIQIEIGSQDDPGFLTDVCTKHPPSIIIDDGSHQAHHVIFTLERMFPALLPGGIYIIEDTAFHFGEDAPNWKGTGEYSVPDYLSNLFRSLMARAPGVASGWGNAKYLFDQIESITVIPSAVVLYKKPPQCDLTGAVAFAEKYIKSSGRDAEGYFELAGFLMSSPSHISDAKGSILKAISLDDRQRRFHVRAAEILLAAGEPGQAVKACEIARDMDDSDMNIHLMLGRALTKAGDYPLASASFQQAINRNETNPWLHSELSYSLEREGKILESLNAVQIGADCASGEFKAHLLERIARLKLELGRSARAAKLGASQQN